VTRLVRSLVVFVVLSAVAVCGGLVAYASTGVHSAATPICKTTQRSTKAKPCIVACKAGQKSTKAKPCIAACKADQGSTKARPCVKTTTVPAITITYPLTTVPRPPATTGAGATTSPSTTTQSTGNTPPPAAGDECPDGTVIPESANAGDEDEDNESGFPSDGDGCV
jgi:hypothetical protein